MGDDGWTFAFSLERIGNRWDEDDNQEQQAEGFTGLVAIYREYIRPCDHGLAVYYSTFTVHYSEFPPVESRKSPPSSGQPSACLDRTFVFFTCP